LIEFGGEYFDCRVLLIESGPVAPGERVTAPIKFLRPELIKSRLKVGDRFRLREARVIAEGTVDVVLGAY